MKKKISKAAVLLLSLTLVMSLFASCGGGGGDTEGKTSLVVAVDNDYATLHPCNWSTTVEPVSYTHLSQDSGYPGTGSLDRPAL